MSLLEFISDFGTSIQEYNKEQKNQAFIMKKDRPWVDKYRPNTISEIISQEQVKSMMETTLRTGDLPHTILYGPPGTGKTSTMLAVCRDLFGPQKMNERVKEINASDERGISLVRNKVTDFVKGALGSKDERYPCPDFKVIILDEADALTVDAQTALKKLIEEYSKNTRFCFICNYINQIIDPICSRCVKIRFHCVSDELMFGCLKRIAGLEGMNIDKFAIDYISKISSGDMRKAITYLQILSYIKDKEITTSDVIEVTCNIPEQVIEKLEMLVTTILEITEIEEICDFIWKKNYPVNQIVVEINNIIINTKTLSDERKIPIIEYTAIISERLYGGANEYIQLSSLIYYIQGKLRKN